MGGRVAYYWMRLGPSAIRPRGTSSCSPRVELAASMTSLYGLASGARRRLAARVQPRLPLPVHRVHIRARLQKQLP